MLVPKDEAVDDLARMFRALGNPNRLRLFMNLLEESKLDLAKGRALATINGQIQSAQAFVAQMEKRRDELEGKKSTYAPRPQQRRSPRAGISPRRSCSRSTWPTWSSARGLSFMRSA